MVARELLSSAAAAPPWEEKIAAADRPAFEVDADAVRSLQQYLLCRHARTGAMLENLRRAYAAKNRIRSAYTCRRHNYLISSSFALEPTIGIEPMTCCYESAAHAEIGPADVVAGLQLRAGAGECDAAGFHDVGLLGNL